MTAWIDLNEMPVKCCVQVLVRTPDIIASPDLTAEKTQSLWHVSSKSTLLGQNSEKSSSFIRLVHS